MRLQDLCPLLTSAIEAARSAGQLMRTNQRSQKKVNESTRHDIKLELDVRCQRRIERILRRTDPQIAILGEEGTLGDPNAAVRWVVDPIDGTVNFAYGIPHCCTSIALQMRAGGFPGRKLEPSVERRTEGAERRIQEGHYVTLLGVVYDPFTDELWTAERGKSSRLNGRVIRASPRKKLEECVVSLGFAKNAATLKRMLPTLSRLLPRVRKIRVMGSAALGLAYVAGGRLDAYIEYGLRVWDVAAGGLLIECAGGHFWNRALPAEHTYHIVASSQALARQVAQFQ
jgi:myo-inositol-1(or 4)-monophosphatase